MVDLIKREQALVQFDSIRKFVSGTVAEKAPILPISASISDLSPSATTHPPRK